MTLFNRGQRAFAGDLPLIRGRRNEIRNKDLEISAFGPEVVIDSICYKPPEAEDLVTLFPEVQRLVMISTVDTYGQDVSWEPITESLTPQPVSDYGKGKLACEKRLLEAFGDRVTIFRPSHILGPGFLTTSLWSRSPCLVDRLRKGKAIPAIDGGRNLMTPVQGSGGELFSQQTYRNIGRKERDTLLLCNGFKIDYRSLFGESCRTKMEKPRRLAMCFIDRSRNTFQRSKLRALTR